jgi:thymidylate synthase
MNNLDKQYTALLQDILDNGVEKKDRTGTGTLSVFGRQIRHNMKEGFPLLTTKKMHWNSIVTELLWFLSGDTNIKYLVDNDCHIWDGDAYKAFCNERLEIHRKIVRENPTCDFQPWEETILKEEFINKIKTDDEFAKKWGELGPIYGKQWRSWKSFEHEYGEDENGDGFIGMWKGKEKIDQIANSINLLKTDPDSRRNKVNAWNVGELDQMVLPPCHTDFQFYTRELSLEERLCIADKFNPLIREDCLTKVSNPNQTPELKLIEQHEWLDSLGPNVVPQRRAISLMWNQRSVDTFLGLPFNIASYGLLLEIIAKEVNMVPDELIGNLGDVHLYLNHIEQAKEQIGRERTHEEMVEMYYAIENKKDREEYWTWETRFDDNNISKHTRNPYPLPTLKHMKTDEFFKILSEDLSMIGHLDNTDFQLENYQSHPTIKAPLSN